jgi:predicted ribosomally synthesized peptide with SipW-like signal peptide
MKKILMSLFTIAIVGALIGGGVVAFFSDVEEAPGTFTAGTIDIAIDDGTGPENPWVGSFTITQAKPCQTWYFEFIIKNVGNNPCVVYKTLKDVVYGPGEPLYQGTDKLWASSEPEWQVDPGDTMNAIGKWIIYDLSARVTGEGMEPDEWWQTQYMDVEGKEVYFHDIKGTPVILGSIPVNGTMTVIQSYHLDEDTPNKHQGDTVSFTIELYAQQIEGTTLLMENKSEYPEDWLLEFGDGISGTLDYNTVGSMFDYEFNAVGLDKLAGDVSYSLVYYPEPASAPWPVTVIDSGTASGGVLDLSGSFNFSKDLNGAKIWLVPSSSISGGNIVGWNMDDFLFETHLIWYNDTDV